MCDLLHPELEELITFFLVQLQTHEQKLHLASADGAPGLENLVANIASEFGVAGVDAATVVMDDNNTDWNSLYPFSAVRFLSFSL